MAQYERIFEKPYADGYENLPSQNTPITAQTLNDKDAAIEHIEDFLDGKEFPTSLADLSDDSTHRLVTDTEKTAWNGAVSDIDYYEQNGFLSKNLFELDIDTSSVPENITYTDNGDGTVTVSSTAAGGARYLILGTYTVKQNQTIKLVGCPSNGGSQTHRLVLTYSGSVLVSDNGNGVTYTNDSGSDITVNVSVRIAANYVSSGLLFKPMISMDANITYSDYMQYADSNVELTSNRVYISAIGTNESGRTTASKAYAIGEHFYKDGKFCTAIASISSGATLTLNTNYVEGTIANAVRYEQTVINMSEGLTYTARDVLRNGRVADIYIYMTAPDTSLTSVLIGTTPFKPQNNFAFLPVYSGAEPYEIVGSVFIRKNTGEIVLSRNSSVASGSLIYIEGSYICQRQ